MNKRFALIALLLAAVMLLSGCNLIGHDDELDGAQVVATVETNQGSTEITKAEWEAYRDYLASYYQQYYQQYFGVTMQLTDDDVKAYGDAAVEQMIERGGAGHARDVRNRRKGEAGYGQNVMLPRRQAVGGQPLEHARKQIQQQNGNDEQRHAHADGRNHH